jgi:hypothetical protein
MRWRKILHSKVIYSAHAWCRNGIMNARKGSPGRPGSRRWRRPKLSIRTQWVNYSGQSYQSKQLWGQSYSLHFISLNAVCPSRRIWNWWTPTPPSAPGWTAWSMSLPLELRWLNRTRPNASAKPSQPTTRLAAKHVTSFGAGWTSTLPLAFGH